MTRTEGNVTYTCNKCGDEEEAFGQHKVYPPGWGIYEWYPVAGVVKKGDLCGKCMALILPDEVEIITATSASEDDDGTTDNVGT